MRLQFLIAGVALFLLATSSYAQVKQHYIAITVGGSVPLGAFSNADAGTFNHWNNSAGFAKTGVAAGVEGAYYFTKHIGVAGTLYYSTHGGFSKADAKKLGDSYTDAFAVDYSTVTTTGTYASLNLLAGPQFSFPISKFIIDIRALAGVVKNLSTPEMTVVLEDSDDATFVQKSSKASAFGWQAGAGFRYPLSDKLGFMFKADYFNSKGIAIDNENRAANVGRLVTNQPLSWLNTSVGLVFTLSNK